MLSRKRLFVVAIAVATLILLVKQYSSSQAVADAKPVLNSDRVQTATFAGGCFWCMESPFEELQGVISVESGYTGDHVQNPTYEQVSYEETGHVEAVRVIFDPDQIRYDDLLEVFWRQIATTHRRQS